MHGNRFLVLVILSCAILAGRGEAQAPGWSAGFHSTGANAMVTDMMPWRGDVIVCGLFDAIGTVSVPSRVARLRQGAWEPLGGQLPGSAVMSLCLHEGKLHALVRLANNLHQFYRLQDGFWVEASPAITTSQTAVASFQGYLHLGSHRLEDGVWYDRLQAWGIECFTVYGDLLVVGGMFTTIGNQPIQKVAGWNGTEVVDAFPGQEENVTSLAVWRGRLYAARLTWDFWETNSVECWNGSTWEHVTGLGYTDGEKYNTHLIDGGERLLLCGYLNPLIIKSGPRMFGSYLRAWDGITGTTLHAPGGAIQYRRMAADGDGVIVGGSFAVVGQPLCSNLGRIENGVMTPLSEPGVGADWPVHALAVSDFGGLACAGGFTAIAGLQSRGVAVFQDQEWRARSLADATLDMIYIPCDIIWRYDTYYFPSVLATVADGHYGWVAGYWNSEPFGDPGTHWVFEGAWSWYPTPHDLEPMGNWMVAAYDGSVRQIYDDDMPGAVIATVSGTARRLLWHNNNLVVGGWFSAIGGVAASNLAIRQSGVWQPLGGGLPDSVTALGRWNNKVVAATRASTSGAPAIVQAYDGATWEILGELPGGRVEAFADYRGQLFVGGRFNAPASDGTPMDGIACWTGTHWQSIGAARPTRALAVYEDQLWVAGGFTHAGGIPASRLSAFTLNSSTGGVSEVPLATLTLAAPSPNPFNPVTSITFALPATGSVRLEAFDVSGRRIAVILDGEQRAAGTHTIAWQGEDRTGRPLPSGTYVLRLQVGSEQATTKVTLVR
jgi:hypothetical protein